MTELAERIEHRSQEDPFEAALKVARHFDQEHEGQKFVRLCGPQNPWLNRLSQEERERIIDIIHPQPKKEPA